MLDSQLHGAAEPAASMSLAGRPLGPSDPGQTAW